MDNQNGQHNQISLTYSITGKKETIDKVNINQPLRTSAEKALKDSGSSRGFDEYEVMYEGKKLDPSQSVETFNFPEGAVIILSLKTGKGGV